MENAIVLDDVYKSFKIHADRAYQLKDYIVLHKSKKRVARRKVLKGISFQVKKGEAVSLIGKNGCGKSTTLKLLTKILKPDSGNIVMNGRVASLIELGAGFHPDMTGRENVYINASIFGIKKKEIDKRINDIIRFSELEEFIDEPVRTYSSGMYMRLAFSVAINVDADILLIDEILAVGDANFQRKCFQWLRELKRKGVTIVLVSHALGQVQEISDRVIWIDNGIIREQGPPELICNHYLSLSEGEAVPKAGRESGMIDKYRPFALERYNKLENFYSNDSGVDGSVKILSTEVLNREEPVFLQKDMLQFELRVLLEKRLDKFSVRCIIRRHDHTAVGMGETAELYGGESGSIRKIPLEIDISQMAPGKYIMTIIVFTPCCMEETRHAALFNTMCFIIAGTEAETGKEKWNAAEWGSLAYPSIRLLAGKQDKGGN